MAIKLEVQQQSNRTNVFNAAESSDGSRGFGQEIWQRGGAIREDPSAAVSLLLKGGEQANQQAQMISKGIGAIASLYQAHKEAEDKVKIDQAENQMKMKIVDIQKNNSERALRGEITYAQVAEENSKAIEFESNNIIENTPFNFGQARDVLRSKSGDIITATYARDVADFQKINTDNAKAAFGAKLTAIAESAANDPGSFQRSVAEWENIKQTDPLYRLNPALYDQQMHSGLVKAANDKLVLLSKEDPEKYFRLKQEGTLDVYKNVIPDEDVWKGFDNDAEHKRLVNANTELVQANKASQDALIQAFIEASNNGGQFPLSRSQIMSHPKFTPEDTLKALSYWDAQTKAEQEKNKDINELNTKIINANGSGVGLSDSEIDKYYTYQAKDTLNVFSKGTLEEQKVKVDNILTFSGGRLPQVVVNTLNKPFSEENARNTAELINYIQQKYPSTATKISDENKDISSIMVAEVDLGAKNSYAQARELRQERIRNAATDKSFNEGLLDKDANYKTLEAVKNVFGDDLPMAIGEDFRAAYRAQKSITPYMGDAELTERALSNIGWGVEKIGGKEFKMFNAPSKIFKDKTEYDAFKVITEQYIKDNQIKEFQLVPTTNKVNGKTQYLMFNWEKNKFEDKAFTSNKDEADSILRPNKGAETTIDNFTGKMKTTIHSPNIVKDVENAQSKVPALGNEKGLFVAIAKTESDFNAYAVNKDSQAYGLYQFVKSTGEQYGLKPGGSIEDQHDAMISYWRDLTKRYNGNTEKALKEYSGYYYNVEKRGEQFANEEWNRYRNKLIANGWKTTKNDERFIDNYARN